MAKVAIVTGNHKGLGRAISEFLPTIGYEIPLLIKSDEYDLREKHVCDRLVNTVLDKFGRLDLLVNNLGNYTSGRIEETLEEDWHDVMDTNLNAAFYLSHSTIKELRKHHGRIINIGFAGLEKFSPHPNVIPYTIAKTGLLTLTRGLAKAEAHHKIMVNMLSPGHLENTIEPELVEKVPVGRLAKFDEALEVIKLLATTDYITGQNIELSGGFDL